MFKSSLNTRIDASKAFETKAKQAITDFWKQINTHSPNIDTAISASNGLTRKIQSAFSIGRTPYYLLQFEDRRFVGNDIIVKVSFHKNSAKQVEFDMFRIKFFAKNGYRDETEWLKGYDFIAKYA